MKIVEILNFIVRLKGLVFIKIKKFVPEAEGNYVEN